MLEEYQQAVNGVIEYFKKEKPKFLYSTHCIAFPALAKFHSVFGIKKLSTGDAMEFGA